MPRRDASVRGGGARRGEALALGVPHLAWLVAFASLFSVAMKGTEAIVVLSGANAFRIGSMCLAGMLASLSILGHRNGFSKLSTGPIAMLLLYSLVAIVSAAYATQPMYALWKSLEVSVDVLVVAALVAADEDRRHVDGLYSVAVAVFTLLLASVAASGVVAPRLAFTESRGLLPFQLQGLVPPINANGVAFIAAFVCLAAVARCTRPRARWGRAFWYCMGAVAFVVLLLAQSRTSLAGFVAGLLVFAAVGRRRRLLWAIAALVLVVGSLEVARELVAGYVQRGQSAELAMKLSGRTRAWSAAWKLFCESPYLGQGFASAGRFDILKGGSVSTLHGSMFDVLAGVGILGLIPWTVAILWTAIRIVKPIGALTRQRRSPGAQSKYAETIAVGVLILVRATTSSGLALHDQTFLLFLILVAVASTPEPGVAAEPDDRQRRLSLRRVRGFRRTRVRTG